MTGSLTDYGEAALLNQVFGGIPFAVPTTLYFGYMVGTPTDQGPGAEPNAGAYQRIGVTNNTTNFPITTNQIKSNGTDIQFVEATANHGLVQAIGVWDSPSSGNLLIYSLLANPITIGVGDAMKIPSGSLSIQFTTGGLSNYVKNALLNDLFGDIPFNVIPQLYFGYTATTPTDAAAGTEPTGGGYSRVGLANNANFFPVATQGLKSNALEIDFPEATDGTQGTAAYVQVFDSLTGGNYLGRYALTSPQQISQGTIPVIPVNTFSISLD